MSAMQRAEAPRSPPKIESKGVSRKPSKDMANTGQSFHGKHAEFADSVDGSDSMAMSVHSPMYNQITNIPTGDYGPAQQKQNIARLLENMEAGGSMATMTKEQMSTKMRSQFGAIFNQTGFDQSILTGIKGAHKLP